MRELSNHSDSSESKKIQDYFHKNNLFYIPSLLLLTNYAEKDRKSRPCAFSNPRLPHTLSCYTGSICPINRDTTQHAPNAPPLFRLCQRRELEGANVLNPRGPGLCKKITIANRVQATAYASLFEALEQYLYKNIHNIQLHPFIPKPLSERRQQHDTP